MPHDIIDNQTTKLVDVIKLTLPSTAAAHFAVGYFFLAGLEAVADVLTNVQELRLLIGNTTHRETIEQIAEGYRRLEEVQRDLDALTYPKRTEREERVQATAVKIGETVAAMPQSDDAQRLVGIIVRLIQEQRLHVRVYTKGRLHAKAYSRACHAAYYPANGGFYARLLTAAARPDRSADGQCHISACVSPRARRLMRSISP